MNNSLMLAVAVVAGLSLGTLFFGGLWWTVRKGVSSPRPALWFLCSMLVRVSICLGGFYIVGRGNWERFMACLGGFIIARLIVLRLTRPPRAHGSPGREARHAP